MQFSGGPFMLRKCGTLVLGSLLLVTAGCEKAVKVSESKQVSAFAMAGVPEENAVRFAGGGAAGNSQRFVATRHKLEVIASESNLPKAWESVIAYCGTIEEALRSGREARPGRGARHRERRQNHNGAGHRCQD